MEKEKLCFSPGDKVKIIKDHRDYIAEYDEQIFLIATKYSIATVISLDEYRADKERRGVPIYENFFSSLHESMEKCSRYPIRYEKVIQSLSREPGIMTCCRVGEIEVVPADILEKIE